MTRPARNFVGASAILLLAALAIVAGAGWWQNRAAMTFAASSWLQTGMRVGELVRDEELRDVGARAERLAGNQAFVGYVAQALAGRGTPGGSIDVASVSDLLRERKAEFGFDLLAVLDLGGRVLVGTDNLTQAERDLSGDNVVATAIRDVVPAVGPWVDDGRVHLVAAVPLLRAGTVEALMFAGTRLDTAFVERIAAASATDIALVLLPPRGPQVVASTLDPARAQQLRTALDAFAAVASDAVPQADGTVIVPVEMGDDTRLATAASLFGGAGDTALISMIPAQRAGGLTRAIAMPIGVGALALVALFGTAMAMLWSTWFAPLLRLLRLSEFAARGDYRRDADVIGTGPIAQLGVSFNVLMMKLRRHARPGATTAEGTMR